MEFHFPKFRSADAELDKTYDYRCELYNRHVKQTPQGRVITEFLKDVPWAGIYNTINCAALHHFREGRWLDRSEVLDEYAKFWCTVGNPRLYSFPIANTILEFAKVTGDLRLADELYPTLVEIHDAWQDHRLENGMYTQKCGYDGMEFSISGDGIRPTINSYMAADKYALALLAERAGDPEKADFFRREADTLRQQINEVLWNEDIGMFGVVSKKGEKQNVREQIGYIPWTYGLADDGRDGCFQNLLDPTCFLAPYGLRTADASHPDYRKEFNHECLWNGPIWPYATAQTLTSVIEYLNTTEHPTITPKDFTQLLLTYAYSHRDTDGSPYLDENMDPDTGIWLAREIMRGWNNPQKDPERGRHYNHSSFIDLVMTGICGIRPALDGTLTVRPLGTSLSGFEVSDVPYHGRLLDVEWDEKLGLKLIVDQKKEYRCAASDAKITVEL